MISQYKFFMTPMCPDCSEIKEFLTSTTVKLKGEIVDASTDEGLKESQKYGVMGVPTMVFLDKEGKEENRASDIDDIRKILDNKSLLDI